MPVSTEQFVQQLTASGLMTKAELDAFRAALSAPRQPTSGEDLARELIRAGKLTKYQATAVVQGKIKGLRFGEYVVLDKLGAGGMGVVLKAQHRRMERTVAVKVLPSAAMKQPGAVDRFYREVKAAAKLTHPNIVAAYDAGEHEGMHYLVMEYVEGRDLSAMVHEGGPLPVKKAVECVLQAARGLAYSHEHGVVHRDIKPANLLLAKDGTLKILDMGLARLRDDGIGGAEATAGRELTQSGQIMGTVDYMSPEQADDTRKADARADIYSLGCTLYRIVSGVCPFDGETMMQKLMAHREKPIPSLVDAVEKLSPGVTPPGQLAAVDAVFRRMLAKLPGERQQSMGEVIAELEAAIAPPKAAPPKRAGGTASAASAERAPQATSDVGEFAFLSTPSAVKAAPRAAPAVPREETVSRQKPESETGDNIPPPPAREQHSPSGKQKRLANQKLLLIGLGGGAVVLTLLGVLVAVFNSRPNSNVKPAAEKPAVAAVKPEAVKPAGQKSDLPNAKIPQQLEAPVVATANAGEWSEPVNLGPVVNSKGEDSAPFVSGDGLTLLFTSDRTGSEKSDTWICTRASIAESWSAPRNLGRQVNSPESEVRPSLSADGLTLYFASKRAGAMDIWMATRRSPSDEFGEPMRLPHDKITREYSAGEHYGAFTISSSGRELFLHYTGRVGIPAEIWQGTRSNTLEPFGSFSKLGPTINSNNDEGEPFLTVDGKTLIFSSNRPGGKGSWDFYACERPSPDAPFSPAKSLGPPVNGFQAELGATLTADGNTLYFSSNRPGGSSGYDLWMCTRKSPVPPAPPPAAESEWSEPVNLGPVVNSEVSDYQPWIAANDLSLVFASHRAGTDRRNLWITSRRTANDPWTTPKSLGPSINLPTADNWQPSLSTDGLELLFASNRNGGRDDWDIWTSRRPTVGEEFGEPSPLAEVNSNGYEFSPRLSRDGLNLLFASSRSGGSGDVDLWQCARATLNGRFGSPTNLGSTVNSGKPDVEPVLSGDGLTLVFASNRAGGIGGYDLWQCKRPRVTEPFGPAENLGPRVNSQFDDAGASLSADGQTLYFHSNRPGGRGKEDLWICTRKVSATSGATAAPYIWPKDAPAPAIAPFNETKAKELQEAWAKYLGVKVDFENSMGMKFRLIPPGEFMMGASHEEIEAMLAALSNDPYARNDELMRKSIESSAPRHAVVLTQAIYLGVHEVTQKQYETIGGKNPSRFAKTGSRPDLVKNVAGLDTANFPVEAMSWIEAVAFCDALARQEGLTPFDRSAQENADVRQAVAYRLPTEAEWEFACRAGTTSRYWNGDKAEELNGAAWTGSNSHTRTHSVGELKPNPFGIFDLLGNVWERVEDGWEPAAYEKFAGKRALDPYNAPLASSPRVSRGGSWYYSPILGHSAVRSANLPSLTSDSIGFRVALPVAAVKASRQRKPAPAQGP